MVPAPSAKISDHCDKAVGYAKLAGLEMTAALTERAVAQVKEQHHRFLRVTISGGEPVLNRELQGIVDAAARMPGNKEGRLLTNDLPATAKLREKITLPENWHWVAAPLDDPSNPLSGKSDPTARPSGRVHWPYFVSPADIGLDATWEKCETRGWCGKGLSPGGWSMCGQAPILGKLFGVETEKWDVPNIQAHVNTPIPEICRHCIYGLARGEQNEMRRAWQRGELPDVSPSFAAVLGNQTQSAAPDGFVAASALK